MDETGGVDSVFVVLAGDTVESGRHDLMQCTPSLSMPLCCPMDALETVASGPLQGTCMCLGDASETIDCQAR